MREFFRKIEEMSEEEFYFTVLCMVGITHEFSAMASRGAKALSQDEKERLRRNLEDLGAPSNMTDEDMKLVCRGISRRIFGVKKIWA